MLVEVEFQPPGAPAPGVVDFLNYTGYALRLDHPSLVRILAVGEAAEGWAVVRETTPDSWLSLAALSTHLKTASAGLHGAVSLARTLAEALEYLHASRFRGSTSFSWNDSARAFLDAGGDLCFALVPPTPGDFRASGGAWSFRGDPWFAAPELFEPGSGGPTRESDSFTVSAVLFELLTGERFVRAPDVASVLGRVVRTEFRPIRDARPDVSRDVEECVRRALSGEPAARPSLAEWTASMADSGASRLARPVFDPADGARRPARPIDRCRIVSQAGRRGETFLVEKLRLLGPGGRRAPWLAEWLGFEQKTPPAPPPSRREESPSTVDRGIYERIEDKGESELNVFKGRTSAGFDREDLILRSADPEDLILRSSGKADAEVPPPVTDDVQFSVTAPATIVPGSPALLDVWAHLPVNRLEVLRRAREELGPEARIKSGGGARVARASVLGVRIRIEGIEVPEPESEILWLGEIGNATFPIEAASDAKEGGHVGVATIHVGGLAVSRLHFLVSVGRRPAPGGLLDARERRTRSAFASYASEDRNAVLGRIQGIQKVVPELDVFLDVASLRSGEDWQQRLETEIGRRDVFFLFWSFAASRSVWVEREWRTALRSRGIGYIDPVPLVSPEEVPPPPELGDHLHFGDWTLAYQRPGPAAT